MAEGRRSSVSDFELLSKIGEGTFGQVYKAKRLADGCLYVIKRVLIQELPRSEQLAAINEVEAWSKKTL
jgi:serine/threonine protein kinase